MLPWKQQPGLCKAVHCGFAVNAALCVLVLALLYWSVVEGLSGTESDVVWGLWQNCTTSPQACSRQLTDVHLPGSVAVCLHLVRLTTILAVALMTIFILSQLPFVFASGGWPRNCVCRAIVDRPVVVCALASTCGLAILDLYYCVGKVMYPKGFVVTRVSWVFDLMLFTVCSANLGSTFLFCLHYRGPRLPLPLPLLATGTPFLRNVGQR